MSQRPTILITNDDGVEAKGIYELVSVAKDFGDVIVFAPDSARSGMSNAMTCGKPVFFKKIKAEENVTWHSCSGTPTDCVKLALSTIMRERKPDLLLSGINHGSNSAVNILYSGTMGAVLDGCVNGIPSVGFSLLDFDENADFSATKKHVRKIIEFALKNLNKGVCLNVNFPLGEIKGLKFCRQADACWCEEFENHGTDSEPEYWLAGEFRNREPQSDDTDEWALSNGYASVVPTQVDMTCYSALKEFGNFEF